MRRLPFRFSPILASCLALLSPTAQAQTLLSGDHTIQGRLCVGFACASSESFVYNSDIMMKDSSPVMLFEDTSTGSTFPSRDWALQANDFFENGAEYFAIVDRATGNQVFRTEAGAPEDSLVILGNGAVGVGTGLPTARLHVSDPFFAAIRLHRDTSAGQPDSHWLMSAHTAGFRISDASITGRDIFTIQRGALSKTLVLSSGGKVGIGTDLPETLLHLYSFNGAAGLKVENTVFSTPGVREMFNMTNNGGSYFTLDNTAAGTTWYFSHENNSPNRFIIADGVADGPEMTLTAAGLLTVQGGFAVGGTALNVPDYVFGPEYTLRPLSEVKAFIEANSHLPEVPSAAQIAENGLDMTGMQMTLLKKVEELTLYTLEQESIIRDQADRLARLEAQEADVAALRQALTDLRARLDIVQP
ncbi:hypothetical protein [Tropicibacter sp. S64]|uniref:hypothetical protein n=1 Tax=Tropicibacter sp. S64 TaxID=3415122 RepID=UPI003C7E173F